MLKRMIAALMACLLLAGALPALAEADAVTIDGDVTVEADALVIEDADAAVDEVIPPADGVELSIDALDANALSDEAVANATEAEELSVSKSCTKKAAVGHSYQITVPGKKIKTCKSSDKKIATVTRQGLVKAKRAGTVKITITPKKGKKLVLTLKVIDPEATRKHYIISHAMGGIGDQNYTNCLEGFLENYAEGHRIFEVDLLYTSDGRMVLWHHWDRPFCSRYEKGTVPTYDQFMSSRLYDQYTPMDLEDLLRLMRDYPDVRVVTDSKLTRKSAVKKQFKTIVSTAKALGVPEVLDRLVVEIYTKEMIDAVESVYHFKEYMMTLYKVFDKAPSSSKLKSMANFCRRKGIATVAMYADWWKPKYYDVIEPYGLDIALYTVNSKRDAEKFFDEGVTALFSDFLPPV